MFHVKHLRYIGAMIAGRSMFHVKQRIFPSERRSCSGEQLFADAEIPEDHVEDVLDVDPAGQLAQGGGSEAQLLGHQVFTAGGRFGEGAAKSGQRGLQSLTVALAGEQGRLAIPKCHGSLPGKGGEQGLNPGAIPGRNPEAGRTFG
jgi:hypothetical protein